VLLGLLALALVDSINPSAIVVTLYLLSRGRAAAHVIVYIVAIFLTYLTLGVLMLSGIGALLPSMQNVGDGRLAILVQGLIGLALLVYALRAPARATSAPDALRATSYAALALLGVAVTSMELPTAVPYFGAIALLTTADLPMAQQLPLLVVYNVIFVLPPTLLLLGHVVFGQRLEARYANLRTRLQAGARETMLWIAGLVGGGLLVSSVVEYVARYVIRGG
jgi:cytochrome c biogenesis protein CcdA